MKRRELINLGIEHQPAIKAAERACADAAAGGMQKSDIRERVRAVVASPEQFADDAVFGPLAAELVAPPPADFIPLRDDLDYTCWGAEDIDHAAREQMRNACRLPISVAAALMPDAHVGYGLPIGGVLATDNAVIPYAVGVDIACRVRLTVFDQPAAQIAGQQDRLEKILERETLFGVGQGWRPKQRPQHRVMDTDWGVTEVTRNLKDTAWKQLGTSGSGNHFVEFGEIHFGPGNPSGVAPGDYLAVVSHSGSRGSGANVCQHYSRIANELHPGLPRELRHLAWLPMDGVGAEYWAAMELMGQYAAANHEVIHDKIARSVGGNVLLSMENHHNYAWKEQHGGREVIVHRKGATPAGPGVLGYIPGTMTDPGYIVRGRGEPRSLHSASHGAGRRMSRTQARNTTRWSHMNATLRDAGVKLLSAGLDETPTAYKNIDTVMAAQADLVEIVAKFQPRIVKMAPDGERPED